jgi:hypothetical protein
LEQKKLLSNHLFGANMTGMKNTKNVKVSDEIHERLRVMAALERRTVQEIVAESLLKATAPYKSIRFQKRAK